MLGQMSPKKWDVEIDHSKKEQEQLQKDIQALINEKKKIIATTDSKIKSTEEDIAEKEILLEECLALNPNWRRKARRRTGKKKEDGEIMPMSLETVQKLQKLNERLVKKLVSNRTKIEMYKDQYMCELKMHDVWKEVYHLASRRGRGCHKGHIFMKNRASIQLRQIEIGKRRLDMLNRSKQMYMKTSWDQAAAKYAQIVNLLSGKKAKLEKEAADSKLSLSERMCLIEEIKEEIEKMKILISTEDKEHRETLKRSDEYKLYLQDLAMFVVKVKRAVRITDDARIGLHAARNKIDELRCALHKVQARLGEIATSTQDLAMELEAERVGNIHMNGRIDLITRDINDRNGALLRKEVLIEDLQKRKNFLEHRLSLSEPRREALRAINDDLHKRHFDLAVGCVCNYVG